MILSDHRGYVIPSYAYTLTHHIYHLQLYRSLRTLCYSLLHLRLPPFSLIIISQLNRRLYYHHYAHNLGCVSLMYLSSLESIGDASFKLVYPPDS